MSKTWNIAILSDRVWRILVHQDSLWAKWVNSNLLDGKSLWDHQKQNNISWSWRNLLKIRPVIRDAFVNIIGNGNITNMWFDNWNELGPLSYVLRHREISAAGFNCKDKFKDIVTSPDWNWPEEWRSMIPQLANSHVPVMREDRQDQVKWISNNGSVVDFSSQQVWKDLNHFEESVPWYKIVWFKNRIPRHSFILWIAVQERLKTQDKMKRWEKDKILKCSLCGSQSDSHNHLFFDCEFSKAVWREIKLKAGLNIEDMEWQAMISVLLSKLVGMKSEILIKKLSLSATVYHVWRERNNRLFKRGENQVNKVVLNILEEVRLKLIGLNDKKVGLNEDQRKEWGLPSNSTKNLEDVRKQ